MCLFVLHKESDLSRIFNPAGLEHLQCFVGLMNTYLITINAENGTSYKYAIKRQQEYLGQLQKLLEIQFQSQKNYNALIDFL